MTKKNHIFESKHFSINYNIDEDHEHALVNALKKFEETLEKRIDVKCGKCGKKIDKETACCEGYGILKINFGYGSRHDEESYESPSCDSCFEQLQYDIGFKKTH